MRNIGLAVQKRRARDFDGDAQVMRRAAVARLGRELELNPQKIKPREHSALADFATVLNLVPDLNRWSSDDKSALRAIIAAKAARTEQRYQQLLVRHQRLRRAVLQIGPHAR